MTSVTRTLLRETATALAPSRLAETLDAMANDAADAKANERAELWDLQGVGAFLACTTGADTLEVYTEAYVAEMLRSLTDEVTA